MPRRKATLESVMELLEQLVELDYEQWDSDSKIVITKDEIHLEDGYSNAEFEFRTLEDVDAKLRDLIKDAERENVKEEVKVGDYTAEVTRSGIEVGCQTISFEEFDNMVKAVAKVRSAK